MRPAHILIFSLSLFFSGEVFEKILTQNSLKRSTLTQERQVRRLLDRYLISSELNYGRLSNLKISITEIIGLSIALNRTAVLPRLESCIQPTEDLGWSSVTEFDQLFDISAFSRASIVSSSGFDLNRICGHDSVIIHVSKLVGDPKPTIKNELSISLDDITLVKPFPFGDDKSFGDISMSYPYNTYFLPQVTETWVTRHMVDRLLPDKLTTLNDHRCIVLGRNFLALNWARLPKEFEEVHEELVPNPSIRADILDFLIKKGLILPPYASMAYATAFIAIHLRMGDFLTINSFRGFGFDCNNNPELLISHVREILNSFPERTPIVLATDDYQSKCATTLRSKFTVILLDEASRFHSKSCQGALFDQEVLGVSSFFLGDKMSTFSQTIHQIRTLRYLRTVDSTIWL